MLFGYIYISSRPIDQNALHENTRNKRLLDVKNEMMISSTPRNAATTTTRCCRHENAAAKKSERRRTLTNDESLTKMSFLSSRLPPRRRRRRRQTSVASSNNNNNNESRYGACWPGTATPTPEELSLELGNGNVKKISLLGSTGSIGTQTLDIVEEHPDTRNSSAWRSRAGGTSSWRRSRSKSSNRKWFRCKMGTTSRN